MIKDIYIVILIIFIFLKIPIRQLGAMIKPPELMDLPDETFDKDHLGYLFDIDLDLKAMQKVRNIIILTFIIYQLI
jgi:hypothetical protein